MKSELAEEVKKENTVFDHKAAKAAADAEVIKAELAQEDSKDTFAKKSVQMRLAVEKVKQEQQAALTRAEKISHDVEDFSGLGDTASSSSSMLNAEDRRVQEVEGEMDKEVAMAEHEQDLLQARDQKDAERAGLSLGDSGDIKVDKSKFSLASLKKGSAELKAEEKKAEKKANGLISKLAKEAKDEAKANGGKLTSRDNVSPKHPYLNFIASFQQMGCFQIFHSFHSHTTLPRLFFIMTAP